MNAFFAECRTCGQLARLRRCPGVLEGLRQRDAALIMLGRSQVRRRVTVGGILGKGGLSRSMRFEAGFDGVQYRVGLRRRP